MQSGSHRSCLEQSPLPETLGSNGYLIHPSEYFEIGVSKIILKACKNVYWPADTTKDSMSQVGVFFRLSFEEIFGFTVIQCAT
ncbi:hypothetical protein L596_019806 [Steinernema carpocapsae]|uniref:Uncharacterized protein n=1 Tax=Steinernema carpocapsae TaxID=34508 RepID=A0A4U5MRU9_STECR|nr:hypothetical protein L596_019806 [Steinernema carpocapsae]